MFPGVFEWVWDLSDVIFIGIVWLVIFVLFSGVTYVVCKSLSETFSRDTEISDETETIGTGLFQK